ncbi:MAG: InlB B-repeat-containing protein, partial [Clostridia bacterium]|nr:InlB B-repeat-containing protein [Clostridia bacterium]
MKKIISLLMAAIFVFSMAVPSFAAVTVNDVAQPAAISSNDATGTDDVFNDVVNFFSGVFESIGNFFKWLFGIDSEEPKYDVTYYWDSSKTSVYEKRSYEKGSSIGSVPVPERTGYTFIGWYPELPDDMPSQDLEVYATWSVKKYTISFNTN